MSDNLPAGEVDARDSDRISRRSFMRYFANGLHLAFPAAVIGGVNFFVDYAQKVRTSIPEEIDGVTVTREEHELLLDLMRYGKHYLHKNVPINRQRVWSALIRSRAWSNVRHLYQGSSLGMPARGEDLGYVAEEFGNLSTPAAGLINHIGSYFQIKREGLRPTSVVLEIAPWTLTTGTSVPRVRFTADAVEGLRELGLSDMKEYRGLRADVERQQPTQNFRSAAVGRELHDRVDAATLVFSIPYMRENLAYLISNATDGDRSKDVFDRSMSLDWSEVAGTLPEEMIRAQIASKEMENRVGQDGNGERLNAFLSTPIQDHLVKTLEALVDLYRRDGVEVRFYLPCAHEYYIRLQRSRAKEREQPFLLEQTTDFMRKFSQQHRLTALGPKSRSKSPGHFVDGWHQTHAGVAEDISQVLYAPC